MRYTLLLLLVIAALHSGCQTSTAQRDKIIADSVKSYTERLNVDHVSYTVTILKVDTISTRELIEAIFNSWFTENTTARESWEHDEDRQKTVLGSIDSDKKLIATDISNNDPGKLKQDQARIQNDSARLQEITGSPDHIKHMNQYASLDKTRDSFLKVFTVASKTDKSNYKALVVMTSGNTKMKGYVYLDNHYKVAVVGKNIPDEKENGK